jgi:ubiquinone/menaquinone biosynthesis C-methylase UbiE
VVNPDRLARVVTAYTAAADTLDSLPFWHHFGRRTVARLALRPGARVLDLCCGSGASALPAAEAVGPAGRVIGVDITDALVRQAAAKAAAAGLPQATFTCASVETLAFEPRTFDAVMSVFGLFFIDDMSGLLARAWNWLRPGGVLAVTSWGKDVLAPGEALFWDAVDREDPSLRPPGHAARLDSAEKIAAVFAAAAVSAPEIVSDRWEMPLASPESFWPVIMGTSNRLAYEALSAPQQERVRRAVTEALREREVRATAMDVLYAVARRSGRIERSGDREIGRLLGDSVIE